MNIFKNIFCKPAAPIVEHTPVHPNETEAAWMGDHFFLGQPVVYANEAYAVVVAKIGFGVCTKYRIRFVHNGIEQNVDPINLKAVQYA